MAEEKPRNPFGISYNQWIARLNEEIVKDQTKLAAKKDHIPLSQINSHSQLKLHKKHVTESISKRS
jgi:hypothetical protein